MPLNDKIFADDLYAIFEDAWNAADGNPRNNRWFADMLAKRINDEIRSGDVQKGIPVVAGGSGYTIDIGKIK